MAFQKMLCFFPPQTPFLNFWEQDYSLIEVTAEKSQHEERATCGQRLAVEMTMSKTHTYYDMQESLHPYFHYSRSSLWLRRTLDKKKMTSQKIDASDCRHLFYPASIIPKAATLWPQAWEFPLRIKKIPNIFFFQITRMTDYSNTLEKLKMESITNSCLIHSNQSFRNSKALWVHGWGGRLGFWNQHFRWTAKVSRMGF